MLPEIDYTGEGPSDVAVARKMIAAAGGTPGTSYLRPRRGLRDLDNDAPCAAALVERLLPKRSGFLLLRIAVRAVEAWLLADRAAYARHCGFAGAVAVADPESVDRPKDAILALAAAGPSSKLSRHLREGRSRGVPDWALLGKWHSEFAETAWNPQRAAASGAAPSLARALRRLSEAIDDLRR